MDDVQIGSDHKLERITFHLPDYPIVRSISEQREAFEKEGGTVQQIWWQVQLDWNGWSILLQPHQNISSLRLKARIQQEIVLCGIGEIRKSDCTCFKRKEVIPVLELLSVYLSFAFGEWSPPMLTIGSNNFTDRSWYFLTNRHAMPNPWCKGWLYERHGWNLSKAFSGFARMWEKSNWREPIELAIEWLIESHRLADRSASSIAFSQIPLEMLAWMMFVDDRNVVENDEFDKLSAASKLQLLLTDCGISLEVPSDLTGLKTIAAESSKFNTGPKLVTKVRNTIVHPNKRNRKLLLDWEAKYRVNASQVRIETQKLFRLYTTLVLLRLFEYEGDYANRLTSEAGIPDTVPWAVQFDEMICW